MTRPARLEPIGEPWDLPALREAYPEWEFSCDGLKVTAVLRDDPSVAATPGPVSTRVMACELAAWRAAVAVDLINRRRLGGIHF